MSDERRALRDLEVAEAVEILGITALAAQIGRLADLIHALKEQNMADFTALNAQIDGIGTAIQSAADRINADLQALKDQLAQDATDQASVDAATAKLQGSVDALNAIDPSAPPVA